MWLARRLIRLGNRLCDSGHYRLAITVHDINQRLLSHIGRRQAVATRKDNG